ncbi:MAG: hypothetical protein R3211_05695 [Balneolaceae bacterium]|nr:hypothetical protein [Balneolaceae bacterium]
METNSIHNAVEHLKANLTDVARVNEWADLMGYENPRRFSEKFLNHYGIRPQKVMELVRLESIIRMLRSDRNMLHIKVARRHSLPDEKSLYNFTWYHSGFSPTEWKKMSEKKMRYELEKLWKEIMEVYEPESTPLSKPTINGS